MVGRSTPKQVASPHERQHRVDAVPAKKIQPLNHNHSRHRWHKRRMSTWSRLTGPLLIS